jgi:hypothetical protein
MIETLVDLRARIDQLRGYEQALEGELRARVEERGGTEAAGEHHRVVLVAQHSWRYDLEALSELQALIPPDQYDKAVKHIPETWQPNKTVLNSLARRGGRVKQVIDAGCIPVPSAPKLEVRSL